MTKLATTLFYIAFCTAPLGMFMWTGNMIVFTLTAIVILLIAVLAAI